MPCCLQVLGHTKVGFNDALLGLEVPGDHVHVLASQEAVMEEQQAPCEQAVLGFLPQVLAARVVQDAREERGEDLDVFHVSMVLGEGRGTVLPA